MGRRVPLDNNRLIANSPENYKTRLMIEEMRTHKDKKKQKIEELKKGMNKQQWKQYKKKIRRKAMTNVQQENLLKIRDQLSIGPSSRAPSSRAPSSRAPSSRADSQSSEDQSQQISSAKESQYEIEENGEHQRQSSRKLFLEAINTDELHKKNDD